jgi:hypothetical protein
MVKGKGRKVKGSKPFKKDFRLLPLSFCLVFLRLASS